MIRKSLLCFVLNRGCSLRTARWGDWQLHLETWISASYSVLFSWAISASIQHKLTKVALLENSRLIFLHCLGAQLPKQWALQLTSLGVKSVKKPGLLMPSTASTFGKTDSVLQYPLGSLLWVLLKLWENWQNCTFLHVAFTGPLRHGHKMYPCTWPVWNPGAPFPTERVSTGLLLWKDHHYKEKGRPWGVAMQVILRMLEAGGRRNVTARPWLCTTSWYKDHACTSQSYPHTFSVHQDGC